MASCFCSVPMTTSEALVATVSALPVESVATALAAPQRTCEPSKNDIWKATARSVARDVIAAPRSRAILQLNMRLASLRPRLVHWVTTARDAHVVRPEICEQSWRHLTVFPDPPRRSVQGSMRTPRCSHSPPQNGARPLGIQCKEEEGHEIFGTRRTCRNLRTWSGATRARHGRNAAPTEQETVEQLHCYKRQRR